MPESGTILRFCERNRSVLDLIVSMDDSDFSEMKTAFDRYDEEKGPKSRPGLIAFLGSEYRSPEFPMGSEQDVVDVALDLAIMKRVYRSDPSDLLEAVSVQLAPSLRDRSETLRARLQALVSNQSIVSIAGVEDVGREADHLLMDSRILSDLRPIYEDTDGDPHLSDLILLHNLRIRYWDDGVERTFTVVLREKDLHDLASKIKRAELKSEDLRRSRDATLSVLSEDRT
jgi:hypothetical protein